MTIIPMIELDQNVPLRSVCNLNLQAASTIAYFLHNVCPLLGKFQAKILQLLAVKG